MKRIVLLLIVLAFIFLTASCQRGDLKISIVRKGDIVQQEGYFIDSSWYLYTGDIAPDDGFIIWIKGTEPYELMLMSKRKAP